MQIYPEEFIQVAPKLLEEFGLGGNEQFRAMRQNDQGIFCFEAVPTFVHELGHLWHLSPRQRQAVRDGRVSLTSTISGMTLDARTLNEMQARAVNVHFDSHYQPFDQAQRCWAGALLEDQWAEFDRLVRHRGTAHMAKQIREIFEAELSN